MVDPVVFIHSGYHSWGSYSFLVSEREINPFQVQEPVFKFHSSQRKANERNSGFSSKSTETININEMKKLQVCEGIGLS
jgi:hypothetical protein